ncbi:hypothetical protein NBRC110019_06850 [Neptunitalea chrysea]|uniref:Uncharacterized protein n=1 Tax=Neptunitalea chrysea TaxID=1647581 RepID=A0A9W6B331_9FLAO|nr:hypothetical protein [Neptunitalea chrysea]GLB51646.1 hypothetical protein NBRC110019_06850 [Neptunitalea chrysea]
MHIKKIIKGSIALAFTISLVSCSEDITLTPLAEDVPPTFAASVDGSSFVDTLTVDAYTTEVDYDFNDEDNTIIEQGTYEAVRILASDEASASSMAIVFPTDAVEGTYEFSDTQGYYLANYLVAGADGVTEANRATTGMLTLILHNQSSHYVEGYFAFETQENTITGGVFKTFYTVND